VLATATSVGLQKCLSSELFKYNYNPFSTIIYLPGDQFLSKAHHCFEVFVHFEYLMASNVRQPQIPLAIDGQSVWHVKLAFAMFINHFA
jgi:hypothetical protein